MTLSEIAARITGDGLMGKFTGGRTSPTRDEIARLAYHFYEKRGAQDGHDVDDWLSAEQQLARHYR